MAYRYDDIKMESTSRELTVARAEIRASELLIDISVNVPGTTPVDLLDGLIVHLGGLDVR